MMHPDAMRQFYYLLEVYKNNVLPIECRKRVAIEAGIPDYWRKYVGLDGTVMGVSSFGESAPGNAVYEHFGITAQAVGDAARERL